MPHSPEDKKKALTRVRRIRGQAEALERALEAGADCAPVLQQLAAIRGAAEGSIVILGITPDRPETGYGYIRVAPGSAGGELAAVAQFVDSRLKESVP